MMPLLFRVTFLAFVSVACMGFPVAAVADAEDAIEFNRDIRPILSSRCFFCHGPDANHREADLRLDVEAEAKRGAIIEGDAAASELIARIVADDPSVQMPPPESGKSLSAEEVDLLKRWISQGAAYEGHWAFEPPKCDELPTVSDPIWGESPIDRFVLARLDAEEIKPAVEASRATLIRRLSLDLTGLPPTVADVEAFENDRSDDAYEKVVDRLLASQRYGEHFARYWLDAARYADTNGYQYDLEREQWVWRDWVIDAFNKNMPFDQFTIEQLAGDLLPDATDQQHLATGFHRNHPITIEGGVIDEEYRTEYVVDRVVTTSTVWLGLTMTCSRCHDHKYDPISQREFYQFFSYFNNVPERGLNGFAPKRKIASPLRKAQANAIAAKLQSAERGLIEWMQGRKEQAEAWQQQLVSEAAEPWRVVVPELRTSQGGAVFEVQSDNSLLATGANSATDVYDFVVDAKQPIHAIRIEALTDASLVSTSTGRAFNGNFVLSEFQVAVANRAVAESSKPADAFADVKVAAAEADYSQNGFPVTNAINGAIGSDGWAVDGNTKHENRTAWFTLAKPIEAADEGKVRIRLHFAYGSSHQIGRIRLSLADRPLLPAKVAAIINKQVEQPDVALSATDRDALYAYMAERFGSDALRGVMDRIVSLRAELASVEAIPETMVMSELPKPRQAHILLRGEYDKPREAVDAGTPEVLLAMPSDFPNNRLGLARWLVMPEHPLTARVTVNRFWQQIFGVGIVKTVEDFGSQGDWPSHPELLDCLATQFVQSGWDVKALIKQMVMSSTYRQASQMTTEMLARDPENRLLSRGPRARLDGEVIRDSALAVSGLLSETLGGPSVFPYHPSGLWQEINNRPGYSRTYQQGTGDSLFRRSLYTFWKRTVAPPSLAAFDAPDREYCIVRRSQTNTPLQAFVMLHDPQFVEAARHLAVRLLREPERSVQDRIELGFRICNARRPSDQESATLASFLQARLDRYGADVSAANNLLAVGETPAEESIDPVQLAAWTSLCRTLLNLSEFITKP